jgi:hypothetical protein
MKKISFVLAPALAAALALPLAAAVEKFGAPLGSAEKVALADLVKSPDAWKGRVVRTEGTVAAVCQEKGCWMTMKTGETTVRVRFKDYAFFVPKDAAGATVTVEGLLEVKTIPEKTAKHYAEETPGGKPAEIKGDQQEFSFTASGVELVRAGKK